MTTAYGNTASPAEHGERLAPLLVPASTALGVVFGAAFAGGQPSRGVVVGGSVVLFALLTASVAGSRASLVLLVVLCAGGVLGMRAWSGVSSGVEGPWDGVARVMSDPVRRGAAVDVVVEVDGQRYQVWARGSPARRLSTVLLGDLVWGAGERRRPDDLSTWLIARHVVGELDVTRITDVRPGAPVYRSANRLRRQLEHGARTLPDVDGALFTGLVYGDDRSLPDATTDAFRAAGLSHLTAVSGQNVAYLLAAASPLLRRLSPWGRWAATIGLIGWFALLTRFEPSVLRASVMAAVGATAFVTGRERSGVGLLAVALTGLLLVDPLLVWSVGLWLSAGATAGLAVLAGPIERLLPGPGWLRRPTSAAIGAQAGVLPVSTLVFGVPSLVSLPANLVAVPVAGVVMLVGLPAALVASVLPDALAAAVQLPCLAGVRFVGAVALAAADHAPSSTVSAAGWLVIGVVLVMRIRSRATGV